MSSKKCLCASCDFKFDTHFQVKLSDVFQPYQKHFVTDLDSVSHTLKFYFKDQSFDADTNKLNFGIDICSQMVVQLYAFSLFTIHEVHEVI